MTKAEIGTLILAVWGAVLSTLLAVWELSKEKRKIKIILELISFEERYQVTVVNIGRRPITITGIMMEVSHGVHSPYETVPSLALVENEPFPQTLGDGQSMVIRLQPVMEGFLNGAFIPKSSRRPRLRIFDAEGRSYGKYIFQEINPKFTTIRKEERPTDASFG